MPPIIKAVLAVAVFVVPLLLFIGLLVRWERGRVQRHLAAVAKELGLGAGSSIGNRIFEFPSALGVIDGHPVWLGTTSDRRSDHPDSRYILFQVVVGRRRDQDLSVVGPRHVETPSTPVPYAEVEQQTSSARPVDLTAGRSSVLQGGRSIDVTDDVLIRTFATPGITNRSWARLVTASARVMVAYADSLAR